ncbi:MAG: serine/threonine-protein kinase [Verrucomicrobiales bacterium]
MRTEFDHFTLRKQIGEGGMSRVFLALDRTLNREAALKILNSDLSKDSERITQFEREARITASISHPNVVKVFSVGNDQGHFFIAMELVPFGSLDELIGKQGKVAEERVLEVAEQLALGLKAAYDAGLIHRDMKPGNILFSQDGTAKVVDFGLALVIDQEDENKEIWATPYYVPPEKLHKKPEDFRSDIYSLGASLFHALAGQPPYSADTASLEELKLIKDKPVSLELFAPHVSSETCALIDRMMARRPNDRYKDYKELIEHIRFARQASHDVVDPGLVARRTQLAARRTATRNAIVAVLAVTILTILGVLGNHFIQRSKRPQGGSAGGSPPPNFVSSTGASQRFLSAREAMFAGDFQKASTVFVALARSDETKQPTLNWARFNAGLCALFRGDTRAAKVEYQSILNDGPYAAEGTDGDLARFFVDVADAMSEPLPVPLEARTKFSTDSSESLALLAFGLKDWEAGYFVEAAEFFELFRGANPGSQEAWVNDYKGLLDSYAYDMKLLAEFPSVRREPTLDQAQAATNKANQLVKQMRSGDSVRSRLNTRIGRMEKLLERLERDDEISEQARMTALRAAERRRLAALRRSLVEYVDGYQMAEAVEAIEAESFLHSDSLQAVEDLLYLYGSSEAFLETLVADIERFGYRGTIPRNGASDLSGSVTGADRESLAIDLGAGAKTAIPVSMVPSTKLIEIARGYLKEYPEMKEYDRRRELIVVFAHVAGATSEAEMYGQELQDELRDFRLKWTRIRESERAP